MASSEGEASPVLGWSRTRSVITDGAEVFAGAGRPHRPLSPLRVFPKSRSCASSPRAPCPGEGCVGGLRGEQRERGPGRGTSRCPGEWGAVREGGPVSGESRLAPASGRRRDHRRTPSPDEEGTESVLTHCSGERKHKDHQAFGTGPRGRRSDGGARPRTRVAPGPPTGRGLQGCHPADPASARCRLSPRPSGRGPIEAGPNLAKP